MPHRCSTSSCSENQTQICPFRSCALNGCKCKCSVNTCWLLFVLCQVNDGYNEKPEGRDNSLKRMSDKEESDGGGKDCLKSPGFWSKVGRRLNRLGSKY